MNDQLPVVPFFRRTWVRIVGFLAVILAIVFCCCFPLAALAWSQRATLFAPWQTEAAPTTGEGPTVLIPENTWDGNLAGPEFSLPARVVGPAIINFWDQKTYCGTLRLNAGEVWDNGYVGAYWEFQNQAALVDRFPHHFTEYLADTHNVNCVILYSVDELRDR